MPNGFPAARRAEIRFRINLQEERRNDGKSTFFRTLPGAARDDISAAAKDGTTLVSLIREIAETKKEGYDAIFDEQGNFHEFRHP